MDSQLMKHIPLILLEGKTSRNNPTYKCILRNSKISEVYANFVLLICIAVYQYTETKVMHFLFSPLRIKGLYMFLTLLAHPQEVLYKRHLVYCVCFMSSWLQPTDITLIQYTKCRLLSAFWGWASNARNM
jgi:hypothetical protein